MTGPRIFESLDAEWALACAESGRAEMVLGWLQEGGVVLSSERAAGLQEALAELERRDRAQGRAHSDRWMRVLLERAAGEGAGAQVAARVVVQAMLPGAVRMTQRLLRVEPGFRRDRAGRRRVPVSGGAAVSARPEGRGRGEPSPGDAASGEP